jgi:hypothetical protein
MRKELQSGHKNRLWRIWKSEDCRAEKDRTKSCYKDHELSSNENYGNGREEYVCILVKIDHIIFYFVSLACSRF